MARTESAMVSLGTSAPDFALKDTDGKVVRRDDFKSSKVLVVMFICNHCPFVKHVRVGLANLVREYQVRGVAFVGINSNDSTKYPEDSPAKMKIEAREQGYTFPYVADLTQEVAKAYSATCTPDFFVYDKNRKLAYRGQMDSSRPGNGMGVTGEDLRAALKALVAGKAAPAEQQPSMGCNIKWKDEG